MNEKQISPYPHYKTKLMGTNAEFFMNDENKTGQLTIYSKHGTQNLPFKYTIDYATNTITCTEEDDTVHRFNWRASRARGQRHKRVKDIIISKGLLWMRLRPIVTTENDQNE